MCAAFKAARILHWARAKALAQRTQAKGLPLLVESGALKRQLKRQREKLPAALCYIKIHSKKASLQYHIKDAYFSEGA